jgi:hypothetical protein
MAKKVRFEGRKPAPKPPPKPKRDATAFDFGANRKGGRRGRSGGSL